MTHVLLQTGSSASGQDWYVPTNALAAYTPAPTASGIVATSPHMALRSIDCKQPVITDPSAGESLLSAARSSGTPLASSGCTEARLHFQSDMRTRRRLPASVFTALYVFFLRWVPLKCLRSTLISAFGFSGTASGPPTSPGASPSFFAR
eukprot:CAMPEP_0179881688 /NCGR_PEP_ID=MMETSP0982-20121206/27660_1 /TAXON_ID=483367 /ORGANISM="non described non described, Strain CCMP 2436" /LENGTH=148 /DNA_ID=CAMNT_0021775777 /DNA_START=104 /DNA_END=550 /DNA_ORIENTATION=-